MTVTADQHTLFDRFVLPATHGRTIQERFQQFHELNPWVYRRLVAMARDLTRRGRKKIGIGMLFEVLRWQWQTTNDPASDFKLNNNYRSRYARLIEAQEPDLAGVFDLQELKIT